MATTFCPRCGTARSGDMRFCASCAYDFQAPTEDKGYAIVPPKTAPAASSWTYTPPPEAPAKEPRSALERLLIVGIAIVVLGGIAAVGSRLGTGAQATIGPGTAQPRNTQAPVLVPQPQATAPAAAVPRPASFATLSARDWALLVKTPDAYVGKGYHLWACVTQFDAATGPDSFRGDAFYRATETWYEGENVMFTGDAALLKPVVKDDIVSVNVVGLGSFSYDTQIGGSTTVPLFKVIEIEVGRSCA